MKIKRQHYVPRFYLRNFGEDLYYYDKTNDKIVQTNIENLALESNFYGLATQKEESVESILGKYDSRYSIALSETIKAADVSKLSLERRLDLAGFITLQLLRSKEARARIENTGDSLFNEVLTSLGIKDVKVGYAKESAKRMHIKTFKNFPYIATIVANMKMIIIKNKTGMTFWTSDNPIALWNEFDQYPFGNLGLACRGIEIHVPLTPKLALLVCDPTVFGPLPNVVEESQTERIIRENWLQIYWSYRFIYSDNKHFPLAKMMLRKNSYSRNPERKRIDLGREVDAKNTTRRNHQSGSTSQNLCIVA